MKYNYSEKDLKRREELLAALEDANLDAQEIRKELDKIDTKYEEERRRKVLHKCFKLSDGMGYARIDGFNNDPTRRPIALVIRANGKSKKKQFCAEINAPVFWDNIDNGKQINPSVFNGYLREVEKALKESGK